MRENDEFDIDYGLANLLVHKPLLTGDRGKVIGYYAVYKLVNGGEAFYFMTRDEAEAHGRKFSKTYNNGPWKTDFDAMAMKTVLKQLLKYAPLSVEFANEIVTDEKVATAITDEGFVDYSDAIDVTETAEMIPEGVDPETGEIVGEEAKAAYPEAFIPDDFEQVEI